MGILGRGAVLSGGNMSPELRQSASALIKQFEESVSELATAKGLRRAVVRSQLSCSSLILLDRSHLWIVAEPSPGLSAIYFYDRPDLKLSADEAVSAGIWEFGYQDPFAIRLPRRLLDEEPEQRAPVVRHIASEWVEAEERRIITLTQLVQIDPIFGPPTFLPEPRLCFVIMPFTDELTSIYDRIIKPTVESHNLVCIRADDIRTNKAIIHNIWKTICEARLIVADLTLGNANVFYELGIAHTVGKETILISQREERRRPFDVFHLRTIIYDDTAVGGEHLRTELSQSILDTLSPTIISPSD